MNINKKEKILILGSNGMVGSSVIRKLEEKEYKNIFRVCREDIDLTNQSDVRDFFKNTYFCSCGVIFLKFTNFLE